MYFQFLITILNKENFCKNVRFVFVLLYVSQLYSINSVSWRFYHDLTEVRGSKLFSPSSILFSPSRQPERDTTTPLMSLVIYYLVLHLIIEELIDTRKEIHWWEFKKILKRPFRRCPTRSRIIIVCGVLCR